MIPDNPLYALAKQVTETGPDDVAFDGLREMELVRAKTRRIRDVHEKHLRDESRSAEA